MFQAINPDGPTKDAREQPKNFDTTGFFLGIEWFRPISHLFRHLGDRFVTYEGIRFIPSSPQSPNNTQQPHNMPSHKINGSSIKTAGSHTQMPGVSIDPLFTRLASQPALP
ncbi:hypothetical protein HPP92_020999 [Vanilla planifolia]|uniref:Uncharacterized protein n=1 Tax=Vanilla planifolia TaxID=51239 RepID=A0A835Q0R0_VANPL|nr:hypothetical protein HPP92_021311 [Vanilla planifolia]KAG0462523.1 hypothetical protein HPP92_020999 [Vanilla planifolia]